MLPLATPVATMMASQIRLTIAYVYKPGQADFDLDWIATLGTRGSVRRLGEADEEVAAG